MIWINIFRRRKDNTSKASKSSKKNEKNGSEILDQMDGRMKRIEELIEKLASKPIDYHINIEKLDINNPALKELVFRLDKLDIKELSGALSLGNNFGVRVVKDDELKLKVKKDEDKKGPTITISSPSSKKS